MKKILLTTTLLALPVMAAAAGPEHFRVWGCDPEKMVPVYGKDGETVLYYWGGDCPDVGGSSGPDLSSLIPADPGDDDDDDGEDPGDDDDDGEDPGDDDGEDPGDDNGDDTKDDTNGDNTDDTSDENDDTSDENDDDEVGPIGIGW